MRPPNRRVIRKAQRLGIRIRDGLELPQFLDLNRKTFSRQNREPLTTDDVVTRMDEACLAHGGRRIFFGEDAQGRVHAAVYVAWADGTAYYLMGGSEPDLRDSGAQILAMWHAILFARTVATRFDFEGSMLPQVERVFRGFGARQLPYFTIVKTPPVPSTVSAVLKASAKFRMRKTQKAIKKYFKI